MIPMPLVVTLFVLGVFIVLQLLLDSLRGSRFKKVSQHLLDIGKRQSLTTVSVVIKARGPKQQVLDLLDHLASFNYDKLQVVIVPRSRKNDRSSDYLTDYRAAHPTMNIRIVRSAGRRDDMTIATRHARGDLLLWMNLTDRLSPRFFEFVSYEFANQSVERIDVPYRYATARTVSDLLAVWSILRSDTFNLVRRKARREHRTVYRRAAYKRGVLSTPTKPGTQLAFIRPRTSTSLTNALIVVTNLVVTVALGYAAFYYLSTDWFFTVIALATVYLLSNLFWLTSSKRYTLSEAVPLLLALPFAVLGSLVLVLKRR